MESCRLLDPPFSRAALLGCWGAPGRYSVESLCHLTLTQLSSQPSGRYQVADGKRENINVNILLCTITCFMMRLSSMIITTSQSRQSDSFCRSIFRWFIRRRQRLQILLIIVLLWWEFVLLTRVWCSLYLGWIKLYLVWREDFDQGCQSSTTKI